MHHWQIITGEYPPQHGGVSDYTFLLAHALRDAGDEVEVWAPPCDGPANVGSDGVAVHRLSGRFGPCALNELERDLRRRSPSARLLVQYVPHMYGFKAMNLPFCAWLSSCSRRAPWVMFHEVAFPIARGQRLAHNFLGATHRLMAAMVARAATRIFVSVPQWEGLLRSLAPMRDAVTWLPIPSTMPISFDIATVRTIRQQLAADDRLGLVGHFSTYSKPITKVLEATLPDLLRRSPDRKALLLGRGSELFAATLGRCHADLVERLHARSDLEPTDVANHLAACDVLVQPYADGVSSRRTSMMAGLALGKAIVTTHGPATESVWLDQDLVAASATDDVIGLQTHAERLVADVRERTALGERARVGYERNFSMRRTVDTLRAAG